MAPPHHFPHTWGVPIPADVGPWDVIVASDILLYVKAYPALVLTLDTLLEPKARAPHRIVRLHPAAASVARCPIGIAHSYAEALQFHSGRERSS